MGALNASNAAFATSAAGADCGTMGKFDPAPPLTIEPHLHCAARKHSQDMGERNFYDHVNPVSPEDAVEELLGRAELAVDGTG